MLEAERPYDSFFDDLRRRSTPYDSFRNSLVDTFGGGGFYDTRYSGGVGLDKSFRDASYGGPPSPIGPENTSPLQQGAITANQGIGNFWPVDAAPVKKDKLADLGGAPLTSRDLNGNLSEILKKMLNHNMPASTYWHSLFGKYWK